MGEIHKITGGNVSPGSMSAVVVWSVSLRWRKYHIWIWTMISDVGNIEGQRNGKVIVWIREMLAFGKREMFDKIPRNRIGRMKMGEGRVKV